jgi:hypothetical protein
LGARKEEVASKGPPPCSVATALYIQLYSSCSTEGDGPLMAPFRNWSGGRGRAMMVSQERYARGMQCRDGGWHEMRIMIPGMRDVSKNWFLKRSGSVFWTG